MPRTRFRWAILPVTILAAGMMSCRSPAPPPVTTAAGAQRATGSGGGGQASLDLPSSLYEGPGVSIEVRPLEGTAEATVTVTFPTGGWELRSDGTRVTDGAVVAHLTFIGPGPDEMVTQALEQKVWSWQSKDPFARALVWVNIVRRGQSPREPDYRLAGRFP
jgi:PrcB C-terminal